MKLTRENIVTPEKDSFRCLSIDQPEFDNHYHYHPEFEITWIVESSGQRIIGDDISQFTKGDLVMIGPHTPHQYKNWEAGKSRARVIQFDRDTVLDAIINFKEFSAIVKLLNEGDRGYFFSAKTIKHCRKKIEEIFALEAGPFKVLRFLELLTIISEDDTKSPIVSFGYQRPQNHEKLTSLKRILDYLDEHWDKDVTSPAVAAVANMHPQSLSRFFKQHLGISFQDYLINLRIVKSVHLLLNTERTITDIAFSCGFNNLSNYYRQFKRFKNSSPGDYRRVT